MASPAWNKAFVENSALMPVKFDRKDLPLRQILPGEIYGGSARS